MEQGQILSLQFTAFTIEEEDTCGYDGLTITDGDGTTLMEKSCGTVSDGNILIGGQSIGSSLPAAIISTSNVVNLVFTTDGDIARSGWIKDFYIFFSSVTSTKRMHCDLSETRELSIGF